MWLWLYYLPNKLLYTNCDEAISNAFCVFAAANFDNFFSLQLKDSSDFYLVHPLYAHRLYLVFYHKYVRFYYTNPFFGLELS